MNDLQQSGIKLGQARLKSKKICQKHFQHSCENRRFRTVKKKSNRFSKEKKKKNTKRKLKYVLEKKHK